MPKLANGYERVWSPGHPLAMKDGYVLAHRYVAHEAGIEVPDGYHVHHRNGVKDDNRLENLEVKPESDHHRDHARDAGFIVNQFGTWPVAATEEERREHQRERGRRASRLWRARRRAEREAIAKHGESQWSCRSDGSVAY